ncbi:MAG: hypothetical protein MJ132_01655 [Clostridia bacterium]|nr:hypothetical protein [Clostridia bacterium]
MKRLLNWLKLIVPLGMILLLFRYPKLAQSGAFSGIVLCGKIIIPSLFPFMAVVLLLMRLIPDRLPPRVERLMKTLFGLSGLQGSVFLLSLIGGYPVGAKLISALHHEHGISDVECQTMMHYCVNAGPGFIVSAVGVGILHSKICGILLLISVTAADLLILLCQRRDLPRITPKTTCKSVRLSTSFSASICDAAESTLNICAYVIFFSAVSNILIIWTQHFSPLRKVLPLLEVTGGVAISRNIYWIAFYIAFGGLSVWCQVFSMLDGIHVSVVNFAISRVIHGILSVMILRVLLFFYPVSITTFSNRVRFEIQSLYSSVVMIVTLFIMIIFWLITATGKKIGGNLKADMLQ